MTELILLFALVIATVGLLAIAYSVWRRRNPYYYQWRYFILFAGLLFGAVIIGSLIGR